MAKEIKKLSEEEKKALQDIANKKLSALKTKKIVNK